MVHISSVPPWKTHLHWFKQKIVKKIDVDIPCPAVVWIRSIEDEFEGAGDILVTDWNGVGFVAVAKLLSGGGEVTAGLGTVPGDFGGLSPVFSCLMLLFRLKL